MHFFWCLGFRPSVFSFSGSVSAKNFHFSASLVLCLSLDIVDKTVMIQLYLLDPQRGETDPTQSPGA